MTDTSIQPNTGQLVLARGHAIPTPLRASLEITGAAPSLIHGTVIIPGTGALEFGEPGGPTPGTGGLALTGQTPGFIVAACLPPAAGAVTGRRAGRGAVARARGGGAVPPRRRRARGPSPVSGT